MEPKLQVLILAVTISLFAIRGAYIYAMSWKWNVMIMEYVEYTKPYHISEYVQNKAAAAFAIPMVRGLFWKFWIWGKAEDCYDKKTNPRLWFEITDHWYTTFE